MATCKTTSAALLVVDDDPGVLAMLQAVLDAEGHSVTTAVNAADARQKLSAGAFDVVITDMRMETAISGFDVIRAARSAPASPTIIVLSAYPIDESEWRDAGAHACLTKPVPIVQLLSTIQAFLLERTAHR